VTSPTDPLYAALLVLDRTLLQETKAAWYAMQLSDLQASFVHEFLPRVLPRVVTAQTAAAALGSKGIVAQLPPRTIDYRKPGQSKLLPAITVHPQPVPRVNPAAFAGAASNGRPLDSLLAQPLIDVYKDVKNGTPTAEAMRSGFDSLDRILTTQVQDAARSAESVTMVVHRVTYYIRVVEPGACGRCLILAGAHYKVNTGFLRHTSCRCHHEPHVAVYDDSVDPAEQSAREIFAGMSVDEQNRAFTVAGAQAIRDGANMPRVVNSRRSGMSTVSDQYGTTYATTTAGAAPGQTRLLPEAIAQVANGNQDLWIQLLTKNGYLYP
jgi:hypothetical protein